MKILYFIGAYGRQYDANEIHYELGREFARAGHTMVVLAPTTRKELGSRPLRYHDGEVEVEHCLVDGTRLDRLLGRLSARLFHYPHFLPALRGLRAFLRRHADAAVLHADAVYPMGAIAALAGARMPIVVSVHGGDVIGRPDYGYGRFAMARFLTRLAFRRARLARINSPLTAQLARERGCPPEKVRLLVVNIGDRFFEPGNLDLPAFRRAAREQVIGEHGLPEDAFLLLSLGRLMPLKGVEEVIRAAAALRETLPQARTLIAGPSRNVPGYGDYRAYLERLAAGLGVADRVTFVGALSYEDAVPRYLAAADLFLSPSHVEGLNRVVAEAGALGTPSIVSAGTGVASLLQEHDAGVVVPVGDVDALAEAVARLAADAGAREALGQRSRALAEKFTSPAVAHGLLELYQEARCSTPLLSYIAYPTSLTLKAANAVQTYLTCQQLRRLRPETLVVVPRLLREPSAFAEIGAVHLPRIPLGKLSRLHRSTLWYYGERGLFALEVALYLLLQRLFHRRRYSVLYVREVICAYVLARLRRLLGARVVYEVHDLESRQPSRAKERWVQPWLRRVDQYLLSQADAVVSLTATFARYLEEQGWRPAAEVAVIPDAYDERLFHPRPRAACRGDLGLPFDAQVILYAGLTFSYRGLEHLVAAFARLAADFPRARLYLVGGRPAEIEPLRGQAAALGVGERVVFPGQVSLEEVPRFLGAADVLVIPGTVSDETASPLKMFEYMAMGVPVVAVDRPALREILPEEGALFVPPDDQKALEAALRQVLGNPEEAATMAARALEAVQRYTYRWRAERILQVVEKVGANDRR